MSWGLGFGFIYADSSRDNGPLENDAQSAGFTHAVSDRLPDVLCDAKGDDCAELPDSDTLLCGFDFGAGIFGMSMMIQQKLGPEKHEAFSSGFNSSFCDGVDGTDVEWAVELGGCKNH